MKKRSRLEPGAALRQGVEAPLVGEVRALRVVVLLALGVAAAALLGIMLWPFLPALVTSGVLGLLGFPAHRWLRRRVRQDEVAALLSTLAVLLVILLPIFVVSLVALQDLASGIVWLDTQVSTGFPLLGEMVARVERGLAGLGLGNLDAGARLTARLQGVPDLVVGRTFRVVSGLGGVVLQVAVGLFTLFYLFRDGERMVENGKKLVPLASGPTELLVRRASEVIFAAVYGHVFAAVVQGTLGGLAFWGLGIPAPAMWGTLMAGLSMIPLVGPAIVWIPAGALLIASGAPLRGALLLVFGVFVISTVDNVIRAVLVSARAQVHPLVVFFGVLGGVLMFGAVGILVGPVLMVTAAALMEMARLALFPEELLLHPKEPPAPVAPTLPVAPASPEGVAAAQPPPASTRTGPTFQMS